MLVHEALAGANTSNKWQCRVGGFRLNITGTWGSATAALQQSPTENGTYVPTAVKDASGTLGDWTATDDINELFFIPGMYFQIVTTGGTGTDLDIDIEPANRDSIAEPLTRIMRS